MFNLHENVNTRPNTKDVLLKVLKIIMFFRRSKKKYSTITIKYPVLCRVLAPRLYKNLNFFMLNSAEHEILNALLISIKISRSSAFLRLR